LDEIPKSSSRKTNFENLFQTGFLISKPVLNYTQTFWKCFKNALNCNKKNRDGKRRILSIIANDFIYEELENNLQVRKIKFTLYYQLIYLRNKL
jgi:hypothetical protein